MDKFDIFFSVNLFSLLLLRKHMKLNIFCFGFCRICGLFRLKFRVFIHFLAFWGIFRKNLYKGDKKMYQNMIATAIFHRTYENILDKHFR